MNTLRSLCVITLVLGIGATALAQHETRVFEVNDLVMSLELPSLAGRLPLRQAMSDEGMIEGQPAYHNRGMLEINRFSNDTIIEFLGQSADPETWDADGAMIEDLGGGRLLVRNSSEVIARVEAALAHMRVNLFPRFDLEVHRVNIAGGSSQRGTALSKSDAANLRASGDLLVKATATHNLPVRVSNGRLITYVGDYDVEVAQEARIADPSVLQFRDGLDAGIQVGTLSTGAIVVHARVRDANMTGMRTVDLAGDGQGRVQLPQVALRTAAIGGVLESGGGISWTSGEHSYLLSVTRLGQNAKPLTRDARVSGFIPTVIPSLRFRSLAEFPSGEPREERFVAESDWIAELLMTNPKWDETGSMIDFRPNGIAVIAEKGLYDFAKSQIASFESSLVSGVGVELRAGMIPSKDMAQVLSSSDLAGLAGRLDVRMACSGLLGEDVEIMTGREIAYVSDYNVEIAQDATIADPIVKTAFVGARAHLSARAAGQGRTLLTGQFHWSDSTGEPVRFDTDNLDLGEIEMVPMGIRSVYLADVVEGSSWSLVHVGKVTDSAKTMVVLARISR